MYLERTIPITTTKEKLIKELRCQFLFVFFFKRCQMNMNATDVARIGPAIQLGWLGTFD